MKFSLRNFVLWVIVVLLLLGLFTLFQKPAPRSPVPEITYSQLLNDADRGMIRAVDMQGPWVQATYGDGRRVNAYAPNDPGLAQRLHERHVVVAVRPPQDEVPWYVSLVVSWLPFIALIAVWVLLSRQMMRRPVAGQMAGCYPGQAFGGGGAPPEKALDDPAYWRGRAEESRAASGLLSDDDCKRHMVEIARGYEYLAQRAEARQRGS
jgi:hypothetical protein